MPLNFATICDMRFYEFEVRSIKGETLARVLLKNLSIHATVVAIADTPTTHHFIFLPTFCSANARTSISDIAKKYPLNLVLPNLPFACP